MKYSFLLFLFSPFYLLAQKKPLDHSVYDGWQSIGERLISNNGKWVVYSITPQEGDADLYIQPTEGNTQKLKIPRGYNAVITEDNRFVICKIKPPYKETREARIKKKKPDEFPKDSLAVIALGTDSIWKWAKIKSFKTPQKAPGWIAYHKEREVAPARAGTAPTQKAVDSLKRTIDSLVLLVMEIKNKKAGSGDTVDADEEPGSAASTSEGTDLVLRNLKNGKEQVFKNVADYYFNTYGQKLLMKIVRSAKDSISINGMVLYDLINGKRDT
ncbi:MAG: S9 family peptidase, partial [Flavisolibacter sp.]|nr:S9 family peptidase [Flavisolibacter sp.]